MDLGRHRIALVAFNSIADTVLDLSSSRSALFTALGRIFPFDGTAIDAGLYIATTLLDQQERPEANGVIVLLTDGQSDVAAALRAAAQAKDQGYRIVTVGVGGDTDEGVLRQIASGPDDYFSALNPQDLPKIYQQVAQQIVRPLGITQTFVQVEVNGEAFEIVEVGDQGITQGDRIRWSVPQLGQETQLHFTVRPTREGTYPVVNKGSVEYVLCESAQAQQPIETQPVVQVLLPPTPTYTPSPVPTFTPMPTPTPTPPPPPDFCASLVRPTGEVAFPVWLWVVFAVLLLLALGLILRRWLQLRAQPPDQRHCYCALIPWFLLPWAILLARRLLAAALALLCTYEVFWPVPWLRGVFTGWGWLWLVVPLLILLLWWLCRRLCPPVETELPPAEITARKPPPPLQPLELPPPWQVRPALIVGIGGSGRWVLTQLKKALLDGNHGRLPDGIRLLLIDTSEQEITNVYRDARGEKQGVEFAGVRLAPEEMVLLQEDLGPLIRQLAREEQPSPDSPWGAWFPVQAYRALGIMTDLSQGTYGRRPMARAGLIQHLAATHGTAEGLWQRLLSACEAIRRQTSEPSLQVILVGSLAGGMSGTLVDVAYLARRAGLQAYGGGHVRLDAFLTTADAYPHHPNAVQARVNTFAALRELSRFQLSDAWPYPMRYRPGAQDAPDGVYEYRLMDDIFLFGGEGYRTSQASQEPWATSLASMADFLVFYLDKGVAAEWARQRQTATKDATTKPATVHEVVVSAAGTYTIRLPLA
ncbi:MAG: VWA domain-containing protein, partial [Chloroflexi bacterium]